jgi:hypothetical protein
MAFARAMRVTVRLGATVWHQNPRSRTLQAYSHDGKTQLDVTGQPLGRGSQLLVTHRQLPTYFVAGDDGTLSSDFIDIYTQQAAER